MYGHQLLWKTHALRANLSDSRRHREQRGTGAAAISAGAIAVTAAGLIAASALFGANEAKAFDFPDIGGAAKSVGKGIVDNAKDLGGAIKRDGKKIGGRLKNAGKGAVQNARDLGGAIKRDSKKIGGHIKDGVSAAYDHNIIRSAVAPNFLTPVPLAMGVCGVKQIGKAKCEFNPPAAPRFTPKPNVPETGPGSWGDKPRIPGGFYPPGRVIANKPSAAKSGTGKRASTTSARRNEVVPTRRSERRNEVVPIKRAGRRNEVVPIRRGGERAPVKGIRKENLKPGRGRETRDTIARDRTVWGRPVGVKRPGAPSQQRIRRKIRDHRVKQRRATVRVRDHRKASRSNRVMRRDHRSRNRVNGRSANKPNRQIRRQQGSPHAIGRRNKS